MPTEQERGATFNRAVRMRCQTEHGDEDRGALSPCAACIQAEFAQALADERERGAQRADAIKARHNKAADRTTSPLRSIDLSLKAIGAGEAAAAIRRGDA